MTANKVNKNSDMLCPVEGCRRLLKPGCVFGTCSRCCLKTQGLLLDAHAHANANANAESAASGSSSTTPIVVRQPADTPVAAVWEERPAAAVVSASERQRLFKARAGAEALRALEDHLLEQFDGELSAPFRAEALAELLRVRRKASGDDPGGRDGRYGRPPPPLLPLAPRGSGTRVESIKWCSIHKNLRRKEHGGGGWSGGGVTKPEEVEAVEDGEEMAGRRRKKSMSSATMVTSSAKVLLVRFV